MTDTAGIVFRFIFFLLDTMVYWIIDQAYWMFSLLSEATILTQDQIQSFSSRIYVLVSIIMLFKLGFSFITYIVNPDYMTDKQKGGGKLIINIVIVISLLVSVPTIFKEAFYVQKIIFDNHIIDRLLLGDSTVTSSKADKSKLLSVYTFLSFFRPTDKILECQNYTGVDISPACISSLNSKDTTGKNPGTSYANALKEGNFGYILNGEIVNLYGTFTSGNNDNNFYQTEKYFLFDYHFFVSTIVGALIAWIIIGFCFDLAIRTVKLAFLQIIAPIPILLSLSPGKKNNSLQNWGKECLSTWASLFVRVGIISFILNLILMINEGGGIFSFVSGGHNNYPLVTVFIIIGLLLFAKELPKLLEDLLGIKMSGKLTLNPWKKLSSVPLIGGLATAGLSYMGNLGKNGIGAIGKPGNFKENMRMAGKESLGRLKSSGLGGSDKHYSGDTQHKLVSKRNQDIKDKEFAGKQSLQESRKMWDSGKNSNNRVLDLKTADDYKKAGYSDEKFINSKLAINQIKTETEGARQTANEAEKQLTAAINRGEPEANLVGYRSAEAEAHKKYEGLQKALTGLEKTHDESIAVANPHARKDAELDRGRKIASEGSYRPGSFDKPVSYKSGSASSPPPPPV